MSSARYVVVACTQKDRWFDLDSERTAHTKPEGNGMMASTYKGNGHLSGSRVNPGQTSFYNEGNPAGAPPLDCWLIDDDDPPPTTEGTPMSEARFIVSDVYEAMAKMPDNSVDLIVTSPPFLALRSYLPADHPDKGKEIGSEPTPAAFLTTLLALTREWRRILTPTGSLCVELGDSYSGSTSKGGPPMDGSGSHIETREETFDNRRVPEGWPPQKSLCLIPSSYAWALAYGHSPFDHTDRIEPMRVRNLIIWHRPNPPVGALGDKVRPSTSYVTVACTAKDRWFDLDSERTPWTERSLANVGVSTFSHKDAAAPVGVRTHTPQNSVSHVDTHGGAPPLDCWFDDATDADVWTIPTAPFAGAHYATFPPALPRKVINLMCPRQVCVVCGEPRRRITSFTDDCAAHRLRSSEAGTDMRERRDTEGHRVTGRGSERMDAEHVTLGWSDCGHDSFRRGLVLDPFAGSGTTLQAASELGRDSIGIDLDSRNLDLARQRLGMFLIEDEVPA